MCVFTARNPQTIRKSSYPSLEVNEETRSKKLRRFVRECPWTDSLLALLINVYVPIHLAGHRDRKYTRTHTHVRRKCNSEECVFTWREARFGRCFYLKRR